jgi:mannosyltransferase OCH1-like enzyme
MDKSVLKRKILFLFGVLVFAFLIFLGRIAEYLASEYIYCTHNYNANESCAECINKKPQTPIPGKIPQHIHQIFFYETSSQLPDKLVKAKNSWIQYHPNYTYTLWNKTSINSLLQREYPFLKKLYDSYGHWVRRADVARYLVLYHYGGWYVDMDVACRRRWVGSILYFILQVYFFKK